MNIINKNKISITSFSELKEVLEDYNDYNYIYLENDINIDEDIFINDFREKITIDGTYTNIMVTLSNSTNIITIGASMKRITFKNLNITSSNTNGILFAPAEEAYMNTTATFENIFFDGTSLTSMQYSNIIIDSSIITIKDTNGVTASYVCEGNNIFIKGSTTIDSDALHKQIFNFVAALENPRLVILPNADVVITSTERELIGSTSNLDFKICHDAKLILTTANGFQLVPTQGCMNVLIEECATFEFLETKHQRIPMLVIYGTFQVNEGADVSIINSYDSTPSDNYNILFRGLNCALILNNPNSFIIYTKNANIIYTLADTKFQFNFSRLNLWSESVTLTSAGTIHTLPDYYWCKDEELSYIEGTIYGSETTITHHDLGTYDVSNFTFQNKKMFSIGRSKINVHPINNTKNTISGHTSKLAEVLIEYNQENNIVDTQEDGSFTFTATQPISDNNSIKITTCVPGSFIYETRNIVSPFTGELSILSYPTSFIFEEKPSTNNPYTFYRTKEMTIVVVDSRLVGSEWKLYAKLKNKLTSKNNFILDDVIIFKDLKNNIIIIKSDNTQVLTGDNNLGSVKVSTYTYSKEKGILLYLDNKYFEINEEYKAKMDWVITE